MITIDTVVTLGGLDGEGMEVIAKNSDFAVDARERILVAHHQYRSIYVFDMAGRFLRTVGREGEGPGEFSMIITDVNVGPEYIHVFEVLNGRTLLDHDFEFVRRDRFPGQVGHSFVTESEVVAFVANIPSSSAVGHKLHFLDPSGEYGVPRCRRRGVPLAGRSRSAIVTGNEESLWIVEWDSTRIRRWDLRPKPALTRIWDRTVDEWERHDHETWHVVAESRPHRRNARRERTVDRLARARPRLARTSVRNVRREGEWENTDPPAGRVYDSWMELLDPDTGETLARHFDKGILLGFVPGSALREGLPRNGGGRPLHPPAGTASVAGRGWLGETLT